ncbi:Arabinan endo-1,5-alpha-L-arabinosidase [Mycena indigotica]|uniref:Arabinan endo-1,5-alpha-L-arabinosidase n=1 Tax=Mycena indigotica TaxID=2126181 RepID=A0A8H6VZD1_9AGAR|nr:Arabinan endo-1,5-alpha-L-arabinosidase [Mycena indigotica]KAF7299342.1 Arabinan endo-1,5-alpha-L-arabinosidase [Mycena indigotica]
MIWLRTLSAVLSFAIPLVHAVVGPGKVTGNTAVHDPSMCKSANGTYFVFSTGVGIEIRTSQDRTAWTLIGSVWPNGVDTWTNAYTGVSNGVLWAPDCTVVGNTFYLYYAASTFGSQKSAIFFAKSSTGLPGSWTNEGLVTSTSSGANYNAIDPNLLIDGSNWYLSLGSFWTGIKSQTLSSSTGKPSSSAVTSLATRTANNGAIEASAVYKFGSFYYLFTSWDNCCQGTSSTYNIRVGRSSSPTGGFVDQAGVSLLNGGGTLVLGSHDSIIGPGGQDIMTDSDGPILVYHYYTSSGSFLGINKLSFDSGWPVVV